MACPRAGDACHGHEFVLVLSFVMTKTLLPRLVRQKKVVHPADFFSLRRFLRDDGHVWVTDWHEGHKKALRKSINLSCLYESTFLRTFCGQKQHKRPRRPPLSPTFWMMSDHAAFFFPGQGAERAGQGHLHIRMRLPEVYLNTTQALWPFAGMPGIGNAASQHRADNSRLHPPHSPRLSLVPPLSLLLVIHRVCRSPFVYQSWCVLSWGLPHDCLHCAPWHSLRYTASQAAAAESCTVHDFRNQSPISHPSLKHRHQTPTPTQGVIVPPPSSPCHNASP